MTFVHKSDILTLQCKVRMSDLCMKVMGLNPCRSSGRIFFSVVNFLCSPVFVFVPPPGYYSGMENILVILLKVQVAGLQPNTCTLHMSL